MNGYGAISRVYDRLNADIDYSAWADGVENAFLKIMGKKPELVLDLACGTGRMTFELAHRGYDMTGIDLSIDMLMQARDRQRDEDILWLNQDMRSFELYGSVGAVVCCLDAVNCLMSLKDVERCFATVHNYLDPGGVFLFDVNTPYKFENIFADNAYILEDEGVYCGWQNYYDEKTGVCDFYLTVFEDDGEGYVRYDETQREKKYSERQLTEALERAGFEVVGFFGGYDMSEPKNDTERWYIAAKKV
jgi:SAM-dependent methyltransferase